MWLFSSHRQAKIDSELISLSDAKNCRLKGLINFGFYLILFIIKPYFVRFIYPFSTFLLEDYISFILLSISNSYQYYDGLLIFYFFLFIICRLFVYVEIKLNNNTHFYRRNFWGSEKVSYNWYRNDFIDSVYNVFNQYFFFFYIT